MLSRVHLYHHAICDLADSYIGAVASTFITVLNGFAF